MCVCSINFQFVRQTSQSGSGRHKNAIWKWTAQKRNLETDGTKTGYRPDAKQLGISRHIIRAIGKIRGMPKAACAMMRTFDLAIIRLQTDK